MTDPSILSVQNLRKNYGSLAAVNDVSFELAAGDSLAIVGESGSGKTTVPASSSALSEPALGPSTRVEVTAPSRLDRQPCADNAGARSRSSSKIRTPASTLVTTLAAAWTQHCDCVTTWIKPSAMSE